MGRKDVGRALDAMGDEGTRTQMASGDLQTLTEALDLTDDERDLVQAAASAYPDAANQQAFDESPDLLVNAFTAAAYYSLGMFSTAARSLALT